DILASLPAWEAGGARNGGRLLHRRTDFTPASFDLHDVGRTPNGKEGRIRSVVHDTQKIKLLFNRPLRIEPGMLGIPLGIVGGFPLLIHAMLQNLWITCNEHSAQADHLSGNLGSDLREELISR